MGRKVSTKQKCQMCGQETKELLLVPELNIVVCKARSACFKRQQDKEKNE